MDTWIVRRSTAWMVAIVLGLGWPGSIRAQNAASELRVATYMLPPFVMRQGDQLTGFGIDLWEEIARRLSVKTSYKVAPDTRSCIELVRSKNADIGVSGIFFTTERDKVVDYTYPILEVGLQVMVRDSGKKAQSSSFAGLGSHCCSRGRLVLWLVAALVVIVIPAHVVWLLDRGNEDGVSPAKNYFPGIFQSLFWAGTALASQVQAMPKQWLARTFGLLWMFAAWFSLRSTPRSSPLSSPSRRFAAPSMVPATCRESRLARWLAAPPQSIFGRSRRTCRNFRRRTRCMRPCSTEKWMPCSSARRALTTMQRMKGGDE